MRPRRGRAKLAGVLAVCAVVGGGVAAAIVLTTGGGHTSSKTDVQVSATPAPTTGRWTPITVATPNLPVIGGGIPVDVDPAFTRTDFSTTLFPLGPRRYRMTVFNTSTLGTVNAFQWYPPTGVSVVKLIGSSKGHCEVSGLTGFGGNQFPGLVLYPNISCTQLALKPPTCMCLGDGDSMTLTFVTDKDLTAGEGDFRLRQATLVFDPVPLLQAPAKPRHIMRVAVPASAGGLTADQRAGAQGALDSLQDSNISLQLMTITTRWVQRPPATCRVRPASDGAYDVYVFWIPWLAAEPYIWLNMHVTDDPETSTFRLGTEQPVLPGGRLKPNGRTVNRRTVDTTLLSRYGPEQAKKSREIMRAHGGAVFTQPSAACQVLANGALRLAPAS
ncbi:MAG: hypothetical protein ABUS54_01485 [Actinomycetota bacterium]